MVVLLQKPMTSQRPPTETAADIRCLSHYCPPIALFPRTHDHSQSPGNYVPTMVVWTWRHVNGKLSHVAAFPPNISGVPPGLSVISDDVHFPYYRIRPKCPLSIYLPLVRALARDRNGLPTPPADEVRDGRPSTAANNKNIDAVRRVIETDRHITDYEIRASLGIAYPIFEDETMRVASNHKLILDLVRYCRSHGYTKDRLSWILGDIGGVIVTPSCESESGHRDSRSSGWGRNKNLTTADLALVFHHRHKIYSETSKLSKLLGFGKLISQSAKTRTRCGRRRRLLTKLARAPPAVALTACFSRCALRDFVKLVAISLSGYRPKTPLHIASAQTGEYRKKSFREALNDIIHVDLDVLTTSSVGGVGCYRFPRASPALRGFRIYLPGFYWAVVNRFYSLKRVRPAGFDAFRFTEYESSTGDTRPHRPGSARGVFSKIFMKLSLIGQMEYLNNAYLHSQCESRPRGPRAALVADKR
ncbi:hypothetical protein EVAR_51721_1 [Eumeta japonica]|uniref:Uncharacterized protein n=1 Tax=Eumeta variegata TaxID=151549 RepID=A0A4C1XKG0_EUMVA|nr:hypothetical protein EVAR_51721_1 [Eumeta japonica]